MLKTTSKTTNATIFSLPILFSISSLLFAVEERVLTQ
jgi:hypothetical protein